MKKRNRNNTNVLKRAVAFGLSVLMCVGNVPSTVLATESEGSDVVVESSTESEAMAESEEEPSTELAVDGSDVDISVDEPVAEEPTENTSEGTTEGSEEGTTEETPTEAPTEGTESSGETEVTPTVTPETEGVEATPTEAPTEEVAEPTVTPTPTPTEVSKPEFDYEGTYNALYSSWSGDYDKTRETLVRKLVNLTQKVKYHSGAGHSSMYLSNCGIGDTNADLFTAENPEYLDDSGLVAWGYYQVGFKEFAQWVADYGLSGAGDTDYLQSVEYAQILPGDIAVASDGWSAVYGGSLDGSPVYIGSYWAEDNGELGVCCDTEYRKDFVKFYRHTGLTDAIKEEEGTTEGTLEGTENTEETEVEPTEIPKEETTENTENTEPTVLTYSDEDVDITATIENGETFGIEEFDITGLELKADAIEEGTDEYNAYVEEVTKSLGDAPEGKKYDFKPYDVYFEYKGEKVEPESGNVQVEMKFKDWVTDYESSSIAHIKGSGEVENLNNDSAEKDTFKFNVSSFSLMGPVLVAVDDAEYDTVGAYGMVYKSGECIIQRGNKPDNKHGLLLGEVAIPEYNDGRKYKSDYAKFEYYKDYISSVYVKDTVTPRSCRQMFFRCINLVSANVSNLNVSYVTDFYSMFERTKLEYIDLSSWVTIEGDNYNNYAMNCMLEYSYIRNIKIGTGFNFFNVSGFIENSWNGSENITTDNYGDFSDIRSFKNYWNDLSNSDRKTTIINFCPNAGFAVLYDSGVLALQNQNTKINKYGNIERVWEGAGYFTSSNVPWTSGEYASKIKSFVVVDPITVTNICCWFDGLTLDSIEGLDNITVKNGYNQESLFEGLTIDYLDCSSFLLKNFSKSGLYDRAFYNAHIGKLILPNVPVNRGENLFSGFVGSVEGLNNIDFSKCSSLYGAFSRSNFTPEIDEFDINVDDSAIKYSGGGSYIFQYCTGIRKIVMTGNLSWGSPLDLTYMFNDCEAEEIVFPELESIRGCDIFGAGVPNLKKFTMSYDFRSIKDKISMTYNGKEIWVKSENTGRVFNLNNVTGEDRNFSGTYIVCKDIDFKLDKLKSVKVKSFIGDILEEPRFPEAERDGSVFLGWYTEENGGTKLEKGQKVTQDIYYAHWKNNSYNLVLKNGTDVILEKTLGSYEKFTLPKMTEKEGYTFLGWSREKLSTNDLYKDCETVTELSYVNGETVVLYAQWQKKDYSTLYFMSGDGKTILSTLKCEKGVSSYALKSPESDRYGYSIVDWNIKGNRSDITFLNTKKYYNDINYKFVDDSYFLVPVYKKKPTITYRYNGMNNIKDYSEVVDFKENVKLPTYTNYLSDYKLFRGWKRRGDDKIITVLTSVFDDTTLYAEYGWRPKYNANGGIIKNIDECSEVRDTTDWVVDKLPEVERMGYTLLGWYLADGVTKVNIGDTLDLSKGLELTAHWVEIDYVTVTYEIPDNYDFRIYVNGNTSTNYTTKIKKGSKLGSNFSIEGKWSNTLESVKSFKNWVDSDGVIYDEDSIITKDVTLYATRYSMVTLTFDPIDGTMYSSSKTSYVQYGKTLDILPGAKKDNYILDGWYTEKDGKGEKLTTYTKIVENKTYYAYYKEMMSSLSDENSYFTFGAEWSNASNEYVDNVNDKLIFHPTKGTTQVASLHMRFEVNKSIGEKKIQEGCIKIEIPKYIWKGYNNEDIGTNNISANLPEYPNKRSGMWFSYIENENSYTILNNTELSGGSGLDIVISYSVDPLKVPGGGLLSDGKTVVEGYDYYSGSVKISVSVDKDNDGNSDVLLDKNMMVEMHTSTYLNIRNYGTPAIKGEWQDVWGRDYKMPDDDKYFYIVWGIRTDNESIRSQDGDYDIVCNSVSNGDLVGMMYISSSQIQVKNNYNLRFGILLSGSSYNTSYIVTRHDKSLLENAPQEGVTFAIDVAEYTNNKSGYRTKTVCKNSVTLYGSFYPTGEFNKTNINGSSTEVVSGGQDSLMNDLEISIPYYLSYEGSSRDSQVIWNSDSNTYTAQKRTISIKDGQPNTLIYSSGDATSPYVWEPNTENISLEDSDYYIGDFSISVVDKDSRYENGNWLTPYNRYGSGNLNYYDVDVFVRYRNSNDYVYYDTITITGDTKTSYNFRSDIEKIVGVELRYSSDAYATSIEVKLGYKLVASNKLKKLISCDIEKGVNSVIKNIGYCNIWNTSDSTMSPFFSASNFLGGNNPANKEIYRLTAGSTTLTCEKYSEDSSKVIYDAEKGIQDNKMTICGLSSTSGVRYPVTSGIFYDLLPYGTFVNSSTITGETKGYSEDNSYGISVLDKGLYNVEFIENWNNTNRTMMKISFTTQGVQADMVRFYYYLRNTYSNIIINGTELKNEVAFVNTSEKRKRYTDRYDDTSDVGDYFDVLEKEYDGFIAYDSENTHYVPVNAFSWGFDKSVKTDSYYSQSDSTLPNNEYTYKLTYAQSNQTSSKKIVFYDVLENGTDRTVNGSVTRLTPQWTGTLQNVDVDSIKTNVSGESTDVFCSPVIYYSTKDRSSFTGADFDVSKSDVWTTTKPSDASTITAIAVDCSKASDGSDFILKDQKVLEVYVTMKAPGDTTNYDKTTYNEAYVYSQKGTDTTSTFEHSDSDVTIKEPNVTLEKSSDPGTGTHEKHKVVYVDDTVTYTLKVTNTGDRFSLKDVVVEDVIPNYMDIDTYNMKVKFGKSGTEVKVSQSPRVTRRVDGQKLTFTVKSLSAGESAYLIIPTIVTKSKEIFDNTAKITSVNGVVKEVVSETMHHESLPIGLTFKKADLNGNYITGAKMQLLQDGTVLQEWDTTGRDEFFELKPGDYTLHEVAAPKGYILADDITFTLSKTGEVTVDGTKVDVVTMVDKFDKYKVRIDKVDQDGNLLSGADLKVTGRENGESADITPITWTSDDNYKEIELRPGTYKLTEVKAPDCYKVAKDIEFVVTDEGKLTVNGEEVTSVEMVDEEDIPEKGSITIVKYDTDGKTTLDGVTFNIHLVKYVDDITQGKVPSGGAVWSLRDTMEDDSGTDENAVSNSTNDVKGASGVWSDIEKTTGSDGKVVFDNLLPGVYEITETKTVSGKTLLADKITATIPMVANQEEVNEKGMDTSKAFYSKSKRLYFFFDVVYNVTNNSNLSVPMTGSDGIFDTRMLFGGMFVVLMGIGVVLVGKKKKEGGEG